MDPPFNIVVGKCGWAVEPISGAAISQVVEGTKGTFGIVMQWVTTIFGTVGERAYSAIRTLVDSYDYEIFKQYFPDKKTWGLSLLILVMGVLAKILQLPTDEDMIKILKKENDVAWYRGLWETAKIFCYKVNTGNFAGPPQQEFTFLQKYAKTTSEVEYTVLVLILEVFRQHFHRMYKEREHELKMLDAIPTITKK